MAEMTDLQALKIVWALASHAHASGHIAVEGTPDDATTKQDKAVDQVFDLIEGVEKAEPHTKLKMAEDAMSETGHVPISYATHDDVLERLKDEYGFVKAVPHEDLTAAIDSALSAEDLPVGYGEFYGDVLNAAAEQIIEWDKEDNPDD